MAEAHLFPIALLIEEMKSEETESRINAMRRLWMVGQALGPERVRNELIPFLNEQTEDDDEVLLAMAEELGGFIELVGGPGEAVVLLGPLASLAMVEETVVRDKAVESACTVIRCLDAGIVAEHVVPMLHRLTTGDWFTARVSACGLFAAAYSRLADSEARKTLRQLFSTLCQDDTPMVRRAASKAIGGLAAVVEKEYVLSELLGAFTQLAGDDQDSVRLLAIENCTAFASILTTVENGQHILPLVTACAGDKSWRVRNNVAKEFHPLSEAMGRPATLTDLLPLYVKLCQDPEAEVRTSAARNAAGYATLVGYERFRADILPALRECAADIAQGVRVAAAGSCMVIAGSLSREQAMESVVPLIERFLTDEVPEVRLKVLEALSALVGAVGAGYTEATMVPALQALGSDALWRVRERVIQQMPLLAEHLGSDAFNVKLLPLYLGTYTDQVNAVRMAAAAATHKLALVLGADWARSHLVPRLVALLTAEGSSYLQRITVLYGMRELAIHVDTAAVAAVVLPFLLRCLSDAVPNVRFVAAQILREALQAGVFPPAQVAAEVQPLLQQAAVSDADPDVRFFAGVALEAC